RLGSGGARGRKPHASSSQTAISLYSRVKGRASHHDPNDRDDRGPFRRTAISPSKLPRDEVRREGRGSLRRNGGRLGSELTGWKHHHSRSGDCKASREPSLARTQDRPTPRAIPDFLSH